ncbi:hypothetical protein EJ08DRAFT_647850 [Tothia fuscella]|uniref:DUF7730 domain-containing protein n=1 Tax=Tothia fuscella TaxID=1048955 RepID=A0A9P4NUY7_9PEZI|nr:hypothetical protein EJ08DRAFT_647850 [Tothia fuscella]
MAPKRSRSYKADSRRAKRPKGLLDLSASAQNVRVTRKSASLRARTKHNEDVPFFRLPREIRDRIYTEVLGGQLIHLDSLHDIRETYCHIDGPEWGHEDENRIYWGNQKGPVNIDLLRTCQKMYHETSLLFFNVNVFSDALGYMTDTFLPTQLAQIRSLRFELYVPGSWLGYEPRAFIQSLPGVQHVHLDLILHYHKHSHYLHAKNHFKEFRKLEEKGHEDLHEILRCLRLYCPLKTAHISVEVVDDDLYRIHEGFADTPAGTSWAWTDTDLLDLASQIEHDLLVPYKLETEEKRELAEMLQKPENLRWSRVQLEMF